MTRPALVVNATELLRQPGSHKHITQSVSPGDIGAGHESIVGDLQVEVDLETTIDDIIVSGTIHVPWQGVCRRCLKPLNETLAVDVHERYTEAPAPEDDAFEIDRGQIDLSAMVREEVLLAVADERVCRDDCPGLCPTCGQNLELGPCDCETAPDDERWSALDQLRG